MNGNIINRNLSFEERERKRKKEKEKKTYLV